MLSNRIYLFLLGQILPTIMIGIYTYSLILIALALMFTLAGIIKASLFTGAGMPAGISTGAFPPTGTSCDASSVRQPMRDPFTANALYAAVGNSFSAVILNFLPTAFNQRKIIATTPNRFDGCGDSSFYFKSTCYQNSIQ